MSERKGRIALVAIDSIDSSALYQLYHWYQADSKSCSPSTSRACSTTIYEESLPGSDLRCIHAGGSGFNAKLTPTTWHKSLDVQTLPKLPGSSAEKSVEGT
jgi:hypothetical protein